MPDRSFPVSLWVVSVRILVVGIRFHSLRGVNFSQKLCPAWKFDVFAARMSNWVRACSVGLGTLRLFLVIAIILSRWLHIVCLWHDSHGFFIGVVGLHSSRFIALVEELCPLGKLGVGFWNLQAWLFVGGTRFPSSRIVSVSTKHDPARQLTVSFRHATTWLVSGSA